jgi:phosphomannomutase
MVKESGGIPLMNRTGHAFIKDRMRAEDAIYGGEMSAHHYFRDFYYCDTGMVPWIMVLELMAEEKKRLSELIGERRERFPVSGEINRKVSDQNLVISSVEEHFGKGAVSLDYTDGVSIEHEKWRMNLRASNTEPLIRLNIETRGDIHLLKERTDTILDHMDKI